MSKAIATPTTLRGTIDPVAIAARNETTRKALGREVERLLRIRRQADDAAFRLIQMLDLDEPDADLEPELGGGYGRMGIDGEADESEQEPSLGWTSTLNQSARSFHAHSSNYDAEAEHDGREPSLGAPETVPGPGPVSRDSGIDRRYSQEHWGGGTRSDLEIQCEDEGTDRPDQDISDAKRNPVYHARLTVRRLTGKAVAS